LVTPKTDVTQAVGRILRMKHEFPVVVDIVDPHDIFQRQWLKRRSFYAKCGYTVVETTSDKYIRAANPLDLVKDDEDREEGEDGEEGEDAEDTSALSGAGAGAGAGAEAVVGACAITPDESIWRTVYKEGKRAEEFKKKLEDDEKPPLLRGKCLINIKTD
jgi:hypothetical protein